MTDAPTQPPSPAQRILDQVESLRDMLVGEPLANNGKYDYCEWCHRYDKGDGKVVHSDSCSWVLSSRDFDTALATVRAALKEMEEEHANETADLIWAHSTASVAVREFKEQAVAKMEALKYASCGFMPLSQFADHNETIDKCISILKGDQA